MSNSHTSGKALEVKIAQFLIKKGVIFQRQKVKFPDFILQDELIEAKNAASTGAPTKLIADLYRLEVLRRETGKKVTLIYNGPAYEKYCTTDRYFKEILKDFPEVNVISLTEYIK